MDKPQFSIIVPAHNEERTIGSVLDSLLMTEVAEIIVVDDGSSDNTKGIVLSKTDSRVRLISHAQNFGQGSAWKTGIMQAKAPILVFFDADVETVTPKMVGLLVNPIISGEADYVIGGFKNFGRITEYLIRPLLRYFVPSLSEISQPISGLFAAKKEFIWPEKIGKRYITIGLVLDAYFAGAKILDINIGQVKHDKRTDEEKASQANSECEMFFQKLIEHKVINFAPEQSRD